MSAPGYDVVVVGGGIHGAGVAQAAAAASYKVLVLEKTRPAAGTSSRSSKLIHGGLRYLETGQFALVRESLREREILLRIARGLVRLVPFLIPVYGHTSRHPWEIRLGLSLYAVLGGLRPSSRFCSLSPVEWKILPELRREHLTDVFCYFDAQTDDAALTRAVLGSAMSLGAELVCPARCIGASRVPGGYRVRYSAAGSERECDCTLLINAAGPWVNHVQDLVSPAPPRLGIDLVQGTHVEFDAPISTCVFYAEAPRDRRAVFIMPWRGGALLGTTETRFTGHPDAVEPLPEEIAYLEETLRFYFPTYSGQRTGSWAGLRVLPAGGHRPFDRPRETTLLPDDPRRPHLIAIYGGKLTAYRATAARVMRLARPSLPRKKPLARTDQLLLTPEQTVPCS